MPLKIFVINKYQGGFFFAESLQFGNMIFYISKRNVLEFHLTMGASG